VNESPLRHVTLLLLSGGGHTGGNVMASLAGRRPALRLVATSDSAEEPALFDFDAAYLAPRLATAAGAFERRVLEIVERERVDLVVPCRDDDVVWLAGLRERRPDIAPKLLCGAPKIAGIANDKWLSFRFCVEQSLPFVPSLACGDEAQLRAFVEQQGLPLVAKPRNGADSRGILLVTSPEQALRAMQKPEIVLQRYLGDPEALSSYLKGLERDGIPLLHSFQGDKHSLQVLIGPAGHIRHVICTRNLVVGPMARSITVDRDVEPNALGVRCAQAFANAGWRGPLNIQCQRAPSGGLMIHEFNVRFTGATAARLHLGFDEIGAAVGAFTGFDIGRAVGGREVPTVAYERLAPRSADGHSIRVLTERGEWRREVT
jgi:hypothetical protein